MIGAHDIVKCYIHDWRFLRQTAVTKEEPRDERTLYNIVEHADLFFCARCLKYQEIVMSRKKYVIDKYVPPPYKPSWDERLDVWWYNLTHRHSAKEVPTQEGQ